MKGSPDRRNEILSCAREEFLKKGYEQASLREICAKADVTTGALYFYFNNKAELFDILVRDVAIEAQGLVENELSKEYELGTVPLDLNKTIVRYLVDNRDIVILLTRKSKGTKYEAYYRRVEDHVTDAILRIICSYCGNDIDRNIAATIARMRISCYEMVLRNNYSYEDACEFLQILRVYGHAGFKSLLDSLKNE